MKKIMSIIAAAMFGFVLGIQPCCVQPGLNQDTKTAVSIEQRDQKIKRDLEDLVKSVYCVRVDTEYKSDFSSKENPIPNKKKRWVGTAFAYKYENGYTYFLTNAHVLRKPQKIIDAIKLKTPFGPFITLQSYTKINEKIVLVDNGRDNDPSDDIVIEEVEKNALLDIAVIRAKGRSYVSNSYIPDENFVPNIADQVYVVGFPEGAFSTVTKGNVSKVKQKFAKGRENIVLDITSTFGSSGSPYFIQRGNKLYLGGLVSSVYTYGRTRVTMFTLGVPLNKFYSMIKSVALDAGVGGGIKK